MHSASQSRGKDFAGAGLLVATGAGAAYLGGGYHVGTLNQMGAGFMPVVLGVLLIVIGITIALTARPPAMTAPVEAVRNGIGIATELRGWACVLGGVAAFVVLGEYGGLVPASFASVFISALGDRSASIARSAALAAALTAFAVLVFHYGLGVPFPLFRWG
ncbi:tripartite tricarboxylate transporter TctB family protein [Xanthobacter sp. KR7-65]|uniref:tripartite tricarboxylate transporter TctB family protein n=1 Tax=Xanthobacter sp. KR7-65 TaxID=3156612 RepID=UPI0032B3370E